jgi:hypothetical protein
VGRGQRSPMLSAMQMMLPREAGRCAARPTPGTHVTLHESGAEVMLAAKGQANQVGSIKHHTHVDSCTLRCPGDLTC